MTQRPKIKIESETKGTDCRHTATDRKQNKINREIQSARLEQSELKVSCLLNYEVKRIET